MVEPDYRDFVAEPADLRRALHAATSLFHLADWVFKTHEAAVRSAFTFTDGGGVVRQVYDPGTFANGLEQLNPDFGRVRGIANAAKHLKIGDVRPVANAPSHAANTAVQTTGYGAGAFGGGPFGGGPRVMLAGPNGNDMEFSVIAESVHRMWLALNATHHRW
jgi:hypothetical protein